jgi:hypothetical protein
MGNFWDAPMKREGEAVRYDGDSKPIYITRKQTNELFRIERHEFMVGGKVIATDLTLEEAEAILKVKGED